MTHKLIAIMMVLCFGAVAQVNLTGTVTDGAGSPLPGVYVVLKTKGISDTTDSLGKYKIIATQSKGEGRSFAKIIPGGRVAGNLLRLDIPEHSPVTVELFDATGVKITTLLKDAHLSGGTYDINLSSSRVAAGLYLIRVRQGNQTWIYRYLAMRTAYQGNLTNTGIGENRKAMAKKSDGATAIDTLVFSKTGYGTIIIPIQSYTGVIDTVLGTEPAVVDIDGNVYHSVRIGTQVWLRENLKTTRYNDGTAIPLVTDSIKWSYLLAPGYCWYNNDPTTYKNPYGALYNWYAVKTGKLAPAGWHVSTNDDWIVLIAYLGGETGAGGLLKEAGPAHWLPPNAGAANAVGFSALPGGIRSGISGNGAFSGIGYIGCWSTIANSETFALDRQVYANSADVIQSDRHPSEVWGYSVRCVRDQIAPGITAQPQPQTVFAGQSVTFSVTATGSDTFSYQWYKNGTAISGATSSSYSLSNVQAADAAFYAVIVSNGILPDVTSSEAMLTVKPATFELTVSAQAGGTITAPSSSPVTVNNGAATTITASPGDGYSFVNWKVLTGAATIAKDSLVSTTVTLTSGNAAVQANFIACYDVLLTRANIFPDEPCYNQGTTIFIIPKAPEPCYHFSGWSGSATGTDIPLSITVNGLMIIQANYSNLLQLTFEPATVTVAGAGSSPAAVACGQAVSITAVQTIDYGGGSTGTFVNWSATPGATIADVNSAATTVTLTGDAGVTANYMMNP